MPGEIATPFTGRVAMWIVAAEIAVVYILSTIPTPLYVLYRQAFHFSQITLTVIYAIYVVGTVATMFFLGRLSDQIGRRPVVLISLAIAASSAIAFLSARSTAWLFPSRVLSGLAIALASSASTAWVMELEPEQDTAAATQIAIGSNLAGLGLGGLMAGVLAQYAPWSIRLSYAVLLALLVPIALLIFSRRKRDGRQSTCPTRHCSRD